MGTVAQLPSFAVTHPALVFTSLGTFLAFFALTPTPNLLSVAALLVVLRLSAWTFAPRGGYQKAAVQAICISLAAGAAHLAPSTQALSNPNMALVIFSVISLLASSFAVAISFASVRISRSLDTPWAKLTVFPALWASGWGFMSKVSPVGQLVTWSPVLGLGPYGWLRPEVGQWAIDWITAAWAVVASEVVGDYIAGSSGHEISLVDVEAPLIDHDDVPHNDSVTPKSRQHPSSLSSSRSLSLGMLLTVLLALMIPSYFSSYLPTPLNAIDETSFGVACALPDPATAKQPGHIPTLQDYIYETKLLQNQANVIFWPEGAVRFDSPDERAEAFAAVREVMNNGKYVGISFDEFVPAARRGESGHRRNSFALIGKTGLPVLEYDKRNLVPSMYSALTCESRL